MGFPAQRLGSEIPAQEDGFRRFAEFRQRAAGRLLDACPGEPAQVGDLAPLCLVSRTRRSGDRGGGSLAGPPQNPAGA